MIGIYKITSPSGKIYIGQSNDINKRWQYYHNYKCKNQTLLYRSLIKHGWETHTFEIVHELPSDVTQTILNEYEKIYIDQYKECGFYMLNLREPGARGKHSDETKKKMSEVKIKEFKENPDKYRSFLSSNKGKTHSEERRKLDSDCKKGNKNSNYGRTGDKHWHYGKPSPKKGVPMSDKQKNKVIDGTKHLMKPVLVYDLNNNHLYDFRSVNHTAESLNLNKNTVRNFCNGKSKKHKLYIFKWKDI